MARQVVDSQTIAYEGWMPRWAVACCEDFRTRDINDGDLVVKRLITTNTNGIYTIQICRSFSILLTSEDKLFDEMLMLDQFDFATKEIPPLGKALSNIINLANEDNDFGSYGLFIQGLDCKLYTHTNDVRSYDDVVNELIVLGVNFFYSI
ncbi:uncharacterized protein LOC121981525 [Zingiber officinale]|uniref:uncharacterized protein LOC121981525 n=1 Tax=Zingiber officinale TaxID=94328 RepID=UPI001C4D6D0F|nr:uncharacterized protein LOC121981525 [Zingiber officinale]XP_042390026.1 uncharacterized protein LOC121981525 [Zingiber officinale]